MRKAKEDVILRAFTDNWLISKKSAIDDIGSATWNFAHRYSQILAKSTYGLRSTVVFG